MSLSVQEQVSLKPYNSFAVDSIAAAFVEVASDEQAHELVALAAQRQQPILLVGGGSNLLLGARIEALVAHITSRGRRIVQSVKGRSLVEAEAGENWHQFVLWTLEQGLAGLENLSLIPGTVGAAPVQNIGAYGVELKDCFAGLTALDLRTGQLHEFQCEDCHFAYRDSLFKRESGRWLILRVRFWLSACAPLHLEYGPIRQRLEQWGIAQPTAKDVSNVVCAIRQEKLPDPALLGNAGSFFKNPVVSAAQAEQLKQRYADLVAYPQADGQVKLAAGWLIERAGWKGYRDGDAGVHALQALVLVNYGKATGAQLLALAQRIQQDIFQRFAVSLEIEPNLLG